MKKNKEYRIQELLDSKMQGEESAVPEKLDAEDLKAYKTLYGLLKETPDLGLPLSFKSDVLRRIAIEKKQASDTKFYWLLAVVSLAGILVIASLSFVFKDTIAPSLGILDRFKGFIVIGLVAVIMFGAVEKKSISILD